MGFFFGSPRFLDVLVVSVASLRHIGKVDNR